MPLVIREFHPASTPAALNEEWILIENTGTGKLSTAGCALMVKSKKGERARSLGSLDPGFFIGPGEKYRLVTGSPSKKAQGSAPAEEDGVKNYHLFLKEAVLKPSVVVSLCLKQHELCSASYPLEAAQ